MEVYRQILRQLQDKRPSRMVQTKLTFSNLGDRLLTSNDTCRVDFMYENLPIKVDMVIASITGVESGFTTSLITFDEPVKWDPLDNLNGLGIPIIGTTMGSIMVAQVQAHYCEVRVGNNLPASVNHGSIPMTNHVQIYAFTTEHKVREVMSIHDGYN